jgi:hypothetical protein
VEDELWGLVWEMEESSGWKRIEGNFGKFWLIMEIPPPQYPSFPFIPLIPKQALSEITRNAIGYEVTIRFFFSCVALYSLLPRLLRTYVYCWSSHYWIVHTFNYFNL